MAGKYDIVIEQGATFSRVITWKDSSNNPVDLTGYAARLQIRPTAGGGEPFLSLTTDDGIELGGADGTIILHISSETSAALNFSNASYDLELVSGPTVKRLLRGSVTLDREYTV